MACDDEARPVDVVCFSTSDTGRAEVIVDRDGEKCGTESALQPVPLQSDAENKQDDVQSNASEGDNILNDSEASNASIVDDAEFSGAVQPAELSGMEVDTESAVRPTESEAIAKNTDIDAQQPSETLDDDAKAEPLEEELVITALQATTSVHDDWLHRGPFLLDMDFHTYIRFTVRKPRPKDFKVSDADRAEHIFLFDSHYALAASHWQQLVIDGNAKLVVMEALKCPLPSLNNGEDNAVFKSLIGTLQKCPGPGHCADPLCCKGGFFQVIVPLSSNQTPASQLPD